MEIPISGGKDLSFFSTEKGDGAANITNVQGLIVLVQNQDRRTRQCLPPYISKRLFGSCVKFFLQFFRNLLCDPVLYEIKDLVSS